MVQFEPGILIWFPASSSLWGTIKAFWNQTEIIQWEIQQPHPLTLVSIDGTRTMVVQFWFCNFFIQLLNK